MVLQMKYLPWILLAIALIVLAIRGCEGPRDHSEFKRKYDSAAVSGSKLDIRNNVLRSELATERMNAKTLKREAHQESDSLYKELIKSRRHPKVVEVIKEVPAVAEAFYYTDKVLSFQRLRIHELEQLDSSYKSKDSLFHLSQDSIRDNLRYQVLTVTQNVTDLERDLKKQSNPFSIGFSAGPGMVVGPDGKVHGGLAVSVGVNLKIRRRR